MSARRVRGDLVRTGKENGNYYGLKGLGFRIFRVWGLIFSGLGFSILGLGLRDRGDLVHIRITPISHGVTPVIPLVASLLCPDAAQKPEPQLMW